MKKMEKILGSLSLARLKLRWKAYRYPETMDCEQCAGKGYVKHYRNGIVCPCCFGSGVQN
jgi:DnaJ-class molecular chaperone